MSQMCGSAVTVDHSASLWPSHVALASLNMILVSKKEQPMASGLKLQMEAE